MTGSFHTSKLSLDPEINRTFHILRRRKNQIMVEKTPSSRSTEPPPGFNLATKLNLEKESDKEELMENNNNKSLKELATPDLNYQPLCIEYPNLDASFELRSGLIQLLLTFHGLAREDPHKHLKEFHVVCSSLKPQGILEEQIKLQTFPFSLADLVKV